MIKYKNPLERAEQFWDHGICLTMYKHKEGTAHIIRGSIFPTPHYM